MQVTPEKRGQAKQMAYGLLYGMGMPALAKSMEVTPDQAQQLSDSFRRRHTYPGVALHNPCTYMPPDVPVFESCLLCQSWRIIIR